MELIKFYEYLQKKAKPLGDVIASHNVKVVFAESCTGGLVSALLTTIPGISQWHCGSFATYRPESKRKWLRVPKDIIDNYTCESEYMAREMAYRVIQQTPEADYSAAVVGHLGSPDIQKDGCYWIGMASRDTMNGQTPHLTHSFTGKCKSGERVSRQFEVAFKVIEEFEEFLIKYGVPR